MLISIHNRFYHNQANRGSDGISKLNNSNTLLLGTNLAFPIPEWGSNPHTFNVKVDILTTQLNVWTTSHVASNGLRHEVYNNIIID